MKHNKMQSNKIMKHLQIARNQNTFAKESIWRRYRIKIIPIHNNIRHNGTENNHEGRHMVSGGWKPYEVVRQILTTIREVYCYKALQDKSVAAKTVRLVKKTVTVKQPIAIRHGCEELLLVIQLIFVPNRCSQ